MNDAIIFDMDGTLCDVSPIRWIVNTDDPRNPGYKNFGRFHEESAGCDPHEWVAQAAREYHEAGFEIIIVTARKFEHYGPTIWFLLLNDIPFSGLYMRENWDNRSDFLVKSEILAKIRSNYNVVAAFDDNPNVLKLWASEGIFYVRVPGWE